MNNYLLMMENGSIIKCMEGVNMSGEMAENIKGSIGRIKSMASENTPGLMVASTTENG